MNYIYFVDLDALIDLWPSWPKEMRIAVCMAGEARFDAVLHHKDEIKSVPAKIARLYDVDKASIFTFPEMDGFESRKIYFSEERQILKSLLDIDHMLESATDYMVNYDFARDEGLDPDEVTGIARDLTFLDPDR